MIVSPPPTVSIPALHIRARIEHNVSAASLALGAGHYPGTGWPGEGRTIGLAGHDVTPVRRAEGGLVFNRLARYAFRVKGKRIIIVFHRRRFVYRITKQAVVSPTDTRVLRDDGHERLVLTTCYPPHSARWRLVTFARRVR